MAVASGSNDDLDGNPFRAKVYNSLRPVTPSSSLLPLPSPASGIAAVSTTLTGKHRLAARVTAGRKYYAAEPMNVRELCLRPFE